MYPQDLRYTKDHEWIRLEAGGKAGVGITQYASEQLGDIVFLDLPAPGKKVAADEELGTVESVKAVSEIFAPVSGEVLESNPKLGEKPELVNQDPHGEGWLVRIALSSPAEVEKLMDAAAYERHVASAGA